MKNSLLKIVLAAILGLSTAAPIASFATHYTSNQIEELTSLESKILQTIDADKMYNNIKFLSKTPRVAGTDQEEAAVKYIRKQFESYGYKTEIQTFTFNEYTAPHTIKLAVDSFTQRTLADFWMETFVLTS
jgi:aminopeptidase YwaD